MAWKFFTKDGSEKQIAAAVTGGTAGKVYGYDALGNLGWQPVTELIQTITLGAPGDITFASIPANFTNLCVVFSVKANQATVDSLVLQFNGDTGTSYARYMIKNANGTGTFAGAQTVTSIILGDMPDNTTSTAFFSKGEFSVLDYTNTAIRRVVQSNLHDPFHGAQVLASGDWSNTSAAVSSIRLTGLAAALFTGSKASLYGTP